MGILRGAWCKGILLAACAAFAAAAHAECNGPAQLTAQPQGRPTAQNALVLGSWFASRHQFACAVATFRGGLKSHPESAQLHYLTGLALAGEDQTAQALPEIREAARLDPSVLKPHLMLAYMYAGTGNHAEADQEWKLALKIDPHSEPALEGLSQDLFGQRNYMGVVELLRNVPLNGNLSITLSRALGLLNLLDDAKDVLAHALEQQPNSLPLANAMSVVLVKQKKYDDAIQLLEHMIKDHPGNQEAELALFRVLVLTNHIDQARPMAPKLLAQRPHDAELLDLNGIVQRSIGNYAQSKTYLEEAIKIDSNASDARFNLGMVLELLGDWKDAVTQLDKAIALGAPEAEAHFELAKALRGMGDNQRAAQELKTYQQLKKDEATRLQAAVSISDGDKALTAGQVKEAVEHYRSAVDAEPNSANYHYKLAIALDHAGDLDGERTQLEAALKIDPKMAGAQKQLGYVLSQSGDTAGSIEHFQLAVQDAPGWVEAWINLAGELAEAGRFPEARKAAATALRLDPTNALARELSQQLAHDSSARQDHP
ncbi:MAG TPA: tetratricopeptide repeat protein [Terracidiphilus sp.]|nr:tetratricopeptide repeat protein [Terracidiphilus sp.]